MDNPIRRIESPASTALQVIEAHRLLHLVTIITHGKALSCTFNIPSYAILCLLCHNKPTTCHTLMSNYAFKATVPTVAYYAYCAIISLLYAIGCHVMPENVILSCSTSCGTLCLVILCQFFYNKPTVCHFLPTKMSCYPYIIY